MKTRRARRRIFVLACLRWSAISIVSIVLGILFVEIKSQAESSIAREYYINDIHRINNKLGFEYVRLKNEASVIIQGLIDDNERLIKEIEKTRKKF